MNEIQMLLHGSEANQQRERLGKIPVNSLWLWGSGMQQALPVLAMEVIYSDDPVIQGLAILSGKKTSALPVTANDIELAEGDILIHFDVLENCLLQQDISCWLQGLQQFEQDWLGPLMTRIKQQSDLEITLIVAKDEAYQLTQKQLASWLGAFFARNRTGLPF